MASSDKTLNAHLTGGRKKRSRCVAKVLWVMAFILAINATITAVMIRAMEPSTVSFDMTGTVNTFMKQMSAESHDEATTEAMVVRFHHALNDSLAEYQYRHRALILVNPAVVTGAEDITDEIQERVAALMEK